MLSIARASLWLASCSTTLGSVISPANSKPLVDQATEFSLTYGYPLIAYAKFALPVMFRSGTNRLEHMRQLSTADFQGVVRPNVDTLYSLAILDLSERDLIVEVPNITDRYWVFPFYDVYGNNYANLGSVGHHKPGKYRIRYANDVGQGPGVQLCDGMVGDHGHAGCGPYQGYVNSPTPYGTFVGRLLVRDNGSDLQRVHQIQNQTALYEAVTRPRMLGPRTPPLSIDLLNHTLSDDVPTRIMEMTARIAPYSPPRNLSDLSRVDHMLRTAGIKHGKYVPTSSNLTPQAQKAEAAVFAYAKKPENVLVLGNGWQSGRSSNQGDYDTDYKMRYMVAYTGYLALTADEALYPSYRDASRGGNRTLTLGADEAYILTYHSKPPLAERGFWSLTGYNAEQYLITNPLDRYAIGDRSPLTYPDGTPVYGTDDSDKPFQILVQPADLTPPNNWTSNWLPAPAGGGAFSIIFRLYAPTSGLGRGSGDIRR